MEKGAVISNQLWLYMYACQFIKHIYILCIHISLFSNCNFTDTFRLRPKHLYNITSTSFVFIHRQFIFLANPKCGTWFSFLCWNNILSFFTFVTLILLVLFTKCVTYNVLNNIIIDNIKSYIIRFILYPASMNIILYWPSKYHIVIHILFGVGELLIDVSLKYINFCILYASNFMVECKFCWSNKTVSHEIELAKLRYKLSAKIGFSKIKYSIIFRLGSIHWKSHSHGTQFPSRIHHQCANISKHNIK